VLSVAEALTRLGIFQARYGQPSVAMVPLEEATRLLSTLVQAGQQGGPATAWAALARAEGALGGALCEVGGEHGIVVGKARQHFQAAMDASSQARRLELGGAAEKTYMVLDAQVHADFAECLADQSTSGKNDMDIVRAAMQEAGRIATAAGPASPGQPRVVMKLTKMRADAVHEESKFSKAVSMYDEYLAKSSSPAVGVEPHAMIELFEVLQGQSIAMSSMGQHAEALSLLGKLEDIQQSADKELHKRSGESLECGSPDKRLWDSLARTYKIRADILQAQDGERAPSESAAAAQKAVDMLRNKGASQLFLLDALITLATSRSPVALPTRPSRSTARPSTSAGSSSARAMS
jgi:tetratricopeptide (TPR) repeat protein